MKRTGKRTLPYIQKKYGASQQMRYVYDTALAPIGYIHHRPPGLIRKAVNKYTPEGRTHIHKKLEAVNTYILTYLMRNPVRNMSIEFNDNRLSLYCGQAGKCAVSKQVLEIECMHCHHIVPQQNGGTDAYSNLVLVTETVHRLIHATQEDTIAKLMESLDLDAKQIAKLNKFRRQAGNAEI